MSINTDSHYRFATQSGAEEHVFLTASRPDLPFGEALGDLMARYGAAVQAAGIPKDSLIFCRLFLSDLANQEELVTQSPAFAELSQGAFSFVEQRPCLSGDLLLLAFHIHHPDLLLEKITTYDSQGHHNSVFLRGAHYNLLMICHAGGSPDRPARDQTKEAFETFEDGLNRHAMELSANTIRTWVFVRDIDNHYLSMSEERKAFFALRNMNEGTRYLASTGIEARLSNPATLVSLDGISLKNLQREQMVRMEAPSHLCPTSRYGITFERGTKLIFGDREHLILSGTASIDANGAIVAPRDILGQTRRTLENIEALLQPHTATLADLSHAIVYLRNPTDAERVRDELRQRLPADIPVVMVAAPVCRPGWLVEIEGIAIKPTRTAFPSFL